MIDRIKGFWDSLVHFFTFFDDLMADVTYFVPPYIQGALLMFIFFALIILACKLVKGIIEVAKSLLASIFFFI